MAPHVRHGAAPSLPDAYVRAIERVGHRPAQRLVWYGHVPALPGSIVTDILTDPLWEDYRDRGAVGTACARAGRRRSFRRSAKVHRLVCDVLRRSRARRSDVELRLIESAADVARIAIEQHRAHQALRHSEARNRADGARDPRLDVS